VRLTTLLLVLSLTIPYNSLFGQVVQDKTDRAKQRTEDKVDRKVDQKIDEAVDQAFDKVSSIFKRKKKKKSESPSSAPKQSPSGSPSQEQPSESQASNSIFGNADVTPADIYQFDVIVTVHTKIIKSSGKVKDEIDFDWMIANQGDFFGMTTYDKKQGKSAVIMDSENKVMITIMEKEKKAMAFSLNDSAQYDDTDDDTDSEVTIQKTGRTKKILGYACDEYSMNSVDMSGTFWLTPQIKMIDLSKMPARMKKKRKDVWANANLNGLMMESTLTEKKKKGRTFVTKTTKVDKSGQTFRMANYEVMSLGGLGF